MTIFDFTPTSDVTGWRIVDDGVMGGKSAGSFRLSEEGHGIFQGYVSLENNGGFSSLRYRFSGKQVGQFSKVAIRLKGDGKRYQFRLKADVYDRHSYIQYFETSGEWQTNRDSTKRIVPQLPGLQTTRE